jgi:hypothetical protein
MLVLLNELINMWGLIEYKDPNRTYTWSNNQKQPIIAKLDRVLVSVNWDIKYPMTKIEVFPKGVSDHSHIKVTFGVKRQSKELAFRFEKW